METGCCMEMLQQLQALRRGAPFDRRNKRGKTANFPGAMRSLASTRLFSDNMPPCSYDVRRVWTSVATIHSADKNSETAEGQWGSVALKSLNQFQSSPTVELREGGGEF